MKNYQLPFCLLISIFLINFYSAQTNSIYSLTDVKYVTIYNQGANIEREGKAKIKKGSNELIIKNVSPKLINESIQFVIFSKQVIVNSVTKEMNYLSKKNHLSDEVIFLKDSLNVIKELIREQNINLEVFNQEKDLLNQNKSVLKLSKEFIIDDLMDLTEYFRERMLDIESNLSKTRQEIISLNKELKKIEKQLQIQNNNAKNQYSNIVIQLTAIEEGEFTFEVSYNVNDAGWIPYYDLRTEKFDAPIDITYKAKVYQKTNENWNDVKLTLSTGNLNQSNSAPAFNPNFVYFSNYRKQNRDIPQNEKTRNFSSNIAEDQPIGSINEEREKSLSSSSFTTVSFSGTQIEYVIDLPYSIPSVNQHKLIDIQKISLPASYDYYCYPKLDNDVFLMCHFKSIQNQNFLPGNGHVYFQGKSIGKTFLDPLSTNSTVDLSLGRDMSIVVERKLMKKYSSELKMGDKIKKERSYQINIRNNKSSEIELKLIDQIPVSNNKGINVELIESSEADYNKQKGKLVWKLNIAPAETVEKSFIYSIKYPEDKAVIGIN